MSVRLQMTASNPLFVRLLPIVLSIRLQMTASNPLFVRVLPIVVQTMQWVRDGQTMDQKRHSKTYRQYNG
jgi:hypothetical protein